MELFFLILLFVVMMYALASGYPVAFALPGASIVTIALAGVLGYFLTGDSGAYFIHDGPIEWLTAGVTNFRGLYWEVERDTLIAIPLFIFMGIMLQRSRIAEDLLVTMAQLFGSIPGGLGISVVFVGALLAATTGIVGATVVAMGLISLPAMLRNNYSKPLATGTICASGTLGQIIPPSIVLIILADQLASAADQASSQRQALYKEATGEFSMPSTLDIISTSAGDMFLGAFLPGLVLVGLYMAYILISALLRPHTAPAVHYDGTLMTWAFFKKVLLALVPPLVLIFTVLGSIIAGIATVNQAGAIGAIGATIMAGYRLLEGERTAYYPAILAVASLVVLFSLTQIFDLNVRTIDTGSDALGVGLAALTVLAFIGSIIWSLWRVWRIDATLVGVMAESAKTTSMVFIILLGAAMLTAAFRGFGGEEIVKNFLTSIPGGFWSQFIVVMLVIFLLGFFLDFIEIAVVVVPIVAPILLADPSANITAVWLGVMIGLNIQTSFLTPPFGFALFYLRGVASSVVKTLDIYKGVVPFIILQLVGLVIVGFYPSLVNYLPVRTYLSSETAPPPKNPRLQACLQDYLFDYYAQERVALEAGANRILSLDLASLPENLRGQITAGAEATLGVFTHIEAIETAEAEAEAASTEYRGIHTLVRGIERDMRRLNRQKQGLENDIRGLADSPYRADVMGQIDGLNADIEALEASIPAEWEAQNADFTKLNAAVARATRDYYRGVDRGYGDLTEAIAILNDTEALGAIAGRLAALQAQIPTTYDTEVEAVARGIATALNGVAGTRDISSPLSEAVRVLSERRFNADKAREELDLARTALNSDLAGRRQGLAVLPALEEYEALIRDSVGLRAQDRLTDTQASAISGCLARHRNIALNF